MKLICLKRVCTRRPSLAARPPRSWKTTTRGQESQLLSSTRAKLCLHASGRSPRWESKRRTILTHQCLHTTTWLPTTILQRLIPARSQWIRLQEATCKCWAAMSIRASACARRPRPAFVHLVSLCRKTTAQEPRITPSNVRAWPITKVHSTRQTQRFSETWSA